MRAIGIIGVLAFITAPVPAAADRCSALQGNSVTQMCGSFTFNQGVREKFTINYGPGTAFHVVGVPGTNTANLTGFGTFQCRGNSFYTTAYTVNNGTAPVWYARLPSPTVGYDTETPAIFDVTLVAAACPGQ